MHRKRTSCLLRNRFRKEPIICQPENKALARRFIEELFNQKNLTIIDELCVPDVVIHSAIGTIQGLEPYKQALPLSFTAFPDLQVMIEDQFAEGDRSVLRYAERGTHKGDLMGIPATDKQFHSTGIMIIRHAADGKVVEAWDSPDTLGILRQLGVVPARGSAS